MKGRLKYAAVVLAALLATIILFTVRHTGSHPSDMKINDLDQFGLILLEGEDGIAVLAVQQGSAAEKSGLMPGDMIVKVDGEAIMTISQAESSICTHTSKQTQVQVRRGTQEIAFTLFTPN